MKYFVNFLFDRLPCVLTITVVFLVHSYAISQLVPEISSVKHNKESITQRLVAGSSVDLSYAQTIPSGNGPTCQIFEPALSDHDSEVADDFIIPVEGRRKVVSFQPVLQCNACGGTIQNIIVKIYDDNSGKPGTAVYIDTFPSVSFPVPLLTLEESPYLDPGTYWMALQVDRDSFEGQVFWYSSLDNTAGPGLWQWRNPGLGFGLGCADWDNGQAICGLGGGVGTLMSINLSPVQILEPIPTLSQWACIILALGMMCVGLVAYASRREIG